MHQESSFLSSKDKQQIDTAKNMVMNSVSPSSRFDEYSENIYDKMCLAQHALNNESYYIKAIQE